MPAFQAFASLYVAGLINNHLIPLKQELEGVEVRSAQIGASQLWNPWPHKGKTRKARGRKKEKGIGTSSCFQTPASVRMRLLYNYVLYTVRLGMSPPPDYPAPSGHGDVLQRVVASRPLWELGFTPEEVYDLYWARGFHSCAPPGKPTASGRFGPVAYPRDCVAIRHYRPFRFTHKMVNRWFKGRTILIGNAAHVFPPCGRQGIACGVADSY